MAKWMEQDSNKWTVTTMKKFIDDQNSFVDSDSGKRKQHSVDALINFAMMSDENQVIRFRNVYSEMYPQKKVVSMFIENKFGGKETNDAVLVGILNRNNGIVAEADFKEWEDRCLELFGDADTIVVFTNKE